MDKPLCIDLFCGLGGWTEGFLAEGYRVVGFDIEVRPYPAQLVIQDVLTIHGSQFKEAAVIVASPPCQNYSYLAMPWSRSVDWVRPDGDGWEVLNSAAAKEMRQKWEREGPDNRLFDACFRIQQEAIEAAGRYIPLVIENVPGAIPWVGRSAWNFRSFHLWGDIPALMPIVYRGGVKVPSSDGGRRTDKGKGARFTSRDCGVEGTKIGGDWFSDPKSTCRRHGSKSPGRKQASAEIAKIPLPLSQHIAAVYRPSLAQGLRLEPAAGNERGY